MQGPELSVSCTDCQLQFAILNKMSLQQVTVWIVNATDNTLSLTNLKAYMNQWNFTNIAANTQESFQVEYDANAQKGIATATYQLEGTGTNFQIQTSDSKGQKLQVDWTGTNTSQYTVFPPTIDGAAAATVKSIRNYDAFVSPLACFQSKCMHTESNFDNGSVCILIQSKPAALSYTPKLNSLGTQWMEYYSDVINDLTLTEMTIPGTHDSGTYQQEVGVGRPWIRTQSLSIRHQLNKGIRFLDLRIGQNQPGSYVLTHDIWKTKYTLKQALAEVVDFIKATKKEIVILDFHRFNVLESEDNFNYEELKAQVKAILEGCYIPAPDGINKTLSKLWKRPNSAQERIVISWNDDSSFDSSYMWPAIDQHWYEKADSQEKLFKALSADFSNPPSRDKMWAVGIFRTASLFKTPFLNAEELSGEIDNWFYGCANWTLKANILMTDFCPDFNNAIHAAICGCLINGRKIVVHVDMYI